MLQQRISFIEHQRVINTEGSVVKCDFSHLRESYIVFVVFHAAFNDISTAELKVFSEKSSSFTRESTELIGVCRDSTFTVRQWLNEVDNPSDSGYVTVRLRISIILVEG